MDMSFLDSIKFDDKGLVPCIAQDADSGEVVMLAYMNRDALAATVEKGLGTYWSRSRQKFWVKGESSGHTQEIREVRFDCDRDCVLLRVKQNVAACHTGYFSCFSWRLGDDGRIVEEGEKVFDPDAVYKDSK